MDYTTNNLSKTAVYRDYVLPQSIWLYGGLYQLASAEGKFVYIFQQADKKNFDALNRVLDGRLGSMDKIKHSQKISVDKFVDMLEEKQNVIFILQYFKAVQKELSKKYDCYKKGFAKGTDEVKIRARFNNQPYIKPYFSTLEQPTIRFCAQWEYSHIRRKHEK